MKNLNLSNLKWAITGKNDQPIAAFDDQNSATQFHSTLQSSGQYSGQTLQIVNVSTGEPVSAGVSDRVS